MTHFEHLLKYVPNLCERRILDVGSGRDEFLREAMGLKPICTPELIQFAEVGGKPIGFIVGLPDTNLAALACNGRMLPFGWWKFLRRLKTVNHLRVLTLGVLPEYRGRGTDGALINAVVVEGVSRGFRSAECGWVLEDNLAMLAPLERLGARVFRRYRVYERGL